MAIIRISASLLWGLAALVAILFVSYAFVSLHGAPAPVQQVPLSVQYSLEYFNAAMQNRTLLVPSQYYAAAKDYAVNGNRVVENDTLYSSILFGNASLPAGYDILIDMANASGMPSFISFPYNFTAENISASLKNCQVARSSTRAFYVCSIYSNVTVPVFNGTHITKSINIGFGNFVVFPNSTSLNEINATIAYNGQNRTYIPSIKFNNTVYYNGMMFLYENTAAFYISSADLHTFYGKEMFLPNSTLGNVIANFLSARIIS